MAKILGIDEAGRGPVAGPLVLCGYLIDDSKTGRLRKLGVKDSKLLAPKKRTGMFSKLTRIADGCRTIQISAAEIDSLRTVTNLNRIEIERMQLLINGLKPDVAVIDAPEANTRAFERKIRSRLEVKCEIVAENFADRNHAEVAAASIIAKVTRDAEVRRLHRRYGNFGSGYPSDPLTVAFLKDWLKRNKELPAFVRKSWVTAQALVADAQQTRMTGFA